MRAGITRLHASGCGASAGLLFAILLAPPVASADPAPQVAILDLPFKVTAMRPPGSEVALAVATSGVLPMAGRKPATADPKAAPKAEEPADIAVVWGEEGGAVLLLSEGTIRTVPIGAEAIEGFAAAETPRVAAPGSRRTVAGPLTAYFTAPLRATGQAGGLTIRERQPLGVTAEPKPVPVATATVTPGPDLVFAARKPRIATLDGAPAILAVTMDAAGTSSLGVVTKRDEGWAVAARTPAQSGGPDGAPLCVAAVADFTGAGHPQIAVVQGPDGDGTLQLWSYTGGALARLSEARGYAGPHGADEADLAAALAPEGAGPSDLVLPAAQAGALAIVAFKGGIRERTRATLPSPVTTGIAVLGRGGRARILAGLADGRVAVMTPPGETP